MKSLFEYNSNKSKILGWQPKYEIEEAINITIEWYDDIIRNKLHPTDKTIQQIQSYLNSLQKYEKISLRKAI